MRNNPSQRKDREAQREQTLTGDHIDHSGSGYYDVTVDGAVIEWQNVISGTNRTIAVRFSWEGSPRDIELLVNGVSAGKSEPVPTGRRGTWWEP